MQITGEKTIFRNDKGLYHIVIQNNILQEDGTSKTIFMNFYTKFKRGVELKNKTKIDIKNAFLSFFTIKENDKIKKIPQLVILDFEVLEEGIDTPSKSYDTRQKEQEERYYTTNYDELDILPF